MSTSTSQIEALRAVYTSTNGENWVYFDNNRYGGTGSEGVAWEFDTGKDPCVTPHFQGVICNLVGPDYQIVTLDLSNMNLRGFLPDDISNLIYLSGLRLSNNNLEERPLPESLNLISTLRVLEISNSKLHGELPRLESLHSLQVLNLNKNNLNGNLNNIFPSSISNMTVLDLSMNQFDGNIDFLFNRNTTQFKYINLGVNCFHITQSNLDDWCPITADNPSSNLINRSFEFLEELYLPALDANCRSLAWDGVSVHKLLRRRELILSNAVECLFRGNNSRILDLSDNGISSELIVSGRSSSLENAHFSYNDIYGKVPAVLFTDFKTLDFSHNRLSGSIEDICDPGIAACEAQDSRIFSYNRLSGFLNNDLNQANNVDVLQGFNLFDCDKQNPLPDSDPNHVEYDCGTGITNSIYYAFVAVFMIYVGFSFLAVLSNSWNLHARDIAIKRGSINNESTSANAAPSRTLSSKKKDEKVPKTVNPMLHDDKTANRILSERFSGASQASFAESDASDASTSRHTVKYGDNQDIDSTLTKILMYLGQIVHTAQVWYSTIDARSMDHRNESMPHLMTLWGYLNQLRRTAVSIILIIVFIILPMVSAIKGIGGMNSKTHEEQYIYFPSAILMRGSGAAAAFTLVWTLIVCIIIIRISGHTKQKHEMIDQWKLINVWNSVMSTNVARRRNRVAKQQQYGGFLARLQLQRLLEKLYNYFMLGLACTVNTMIVLGLHIAFIVIIVDSENSSEKQGAQFGLALVRLVWDFLVVPYIIRQWQEWYPESFLNDLASSVQLQTFTILIDGILIPIIAGAFTNDSCFENLVVEDSMDDLGTSSNYSSCYWYLTDGSCESGSYGVDGEITTETSTSYSPGFMYNFMCSGAIVSQYLPVYLYTFTMMAFIFPTMTALITQVSIDYLPYDLMSFMWDGMLWPFNTQAEGLSLIRVDRILVLQYYNFGVLLTFGLIAPLLGLIIGITIITNTFLWQIVIGRYLYQSPRCEQNEMNRSSESDAIGRGSQNSPSPDPANSNVTEGDAKKEAVRQSVMTTKSNSPGRDGEDDETTKTNKQRVNHIEQMIADIKESEDRQKLSDSDDDDDAEAEAINAAIQSAADPNRRTSARTNRLNLLNKLKGSEMGINSDPTGGMNQACEGVREANQGMSWGLVWLSTITIALLLFDIVGDAHGIDQGHVIMAMILVAPALIYVTRVFFNFISKYLGTCLGNIKDATINSVAKMNEWELSARRDTFTDSVNGERPKTTKITADLSEDFFSNSETDTVQPFGEL